jgi:hypothetical protein
MLTDTTDLAEYRRRRLPPTRYLYRITRDLPEHGIRAGDILRHDPADRREPFVIVRLVPMDVAELRARYAEGVAVALEVTPPAVRTSGAKPPTGGPAVAPAVPAPERRKLPRIIPLVPRPQTAVERN